MNAFQSLFILIFSFTFSSSLFAQEVNLKNPLMWSSGCSGNALAQITKKTNFTFEENRLKMKMVSNACKGTNEYKLKEMQGIELPTDAKKVFYDVSDRMGVIVTNEEGFFVFFKKKSGSYSFLDLGAVDKKALKGRKLKDEKSKYASILTQIDASIEATEQAEKEAKAKAKEDAKEAQKVAEIEKYIKSLGEMYPDNIGKVLFAQRRLRVQKPSDDSSSDMVTEFELGAGPLYARAYFDNSLRRGGEPIKNIRRVDNITYSIGDVSVSSLDLNIEYKKYSPSTSRAASYFVEGLSGAFPMISAEKKYYGSTHAVAEDAFRILLMKMGDKLQIGRSYTLKVEVSTDHYTMENKKWVKVPGEVIAEGEIKMKVTPKSENVLSLLCRCKKEGMQDKKIKEQIENLLSTDDSIEKIYNIRITSRDYKIEYQRGNPVRRTIEAEVQFLSKDGHLLLWRGIVQYPYNGSSYSDVASFYKSLLSIPISPTCLY